MGFSGKNGNYGVWEFLGYFYFLGRDLTLKCVGNPGYTAVIVQTWSEEDPLVNRNTISTKLRHFRVVNSTI